MSHEGRVELPGDHERGEELSLTQRAFYRLLWVTSHVVGRLYFRMEVTGREHVPATGPFVLSPVHRSNLDSPLVSTVTGRRMRYMGKESLWKTRFGAWFFTTAGGFPVERGKADRSALRALAAVIERGEPVVIFPEGTRQSGPELGEFFNGPAYVACRTQVPIVPVGIGGSERAMGKGMKFPRPSKMTVVVGPPLIPPAPPEGKDRVPRRAVNQLTDELREALTGLFAEAQRRAGVPH